jgi:hypothetical protein
MSRNKIVYIIEAIVIGAIGGIITYFFLLMFFLSLGD